MTDGFGRKIKYLRLSVTELCNLRCRYCMPEEGICKKSHSDMLTEEEMIRAVHICAGLGVQKVRITGGEPLVKRNILSICRNVASIPGIDELSITTNGTLLAPTAKELVSCGVRRVNISIDTVDPEKYRYITRLGNLDDALCGLESALSAGFEKVKVNCVLMKGFNDEEIRDLASLAIEYPIDLRFIELMPLEALKSYKEVSFVPCSRVLEEMPELEPLPDEDGVAKLYSLPGAKGRIGLISPLSSHFCAACDRIRLTADGKIKPCLHSSDEYSIKGLSDEEMQAQFASAILAKPEWHGELSAQSPSSAGRSMDRIGG